MLSLIYNKRFIKKSFLLGFSEKVLTLFSFFGSLSRSRRFKVLLNLSDDTNAMRPANLISFSLKSRRFNVFVSAFILKFEKILSNYS